MDNELTLFDRVEVIKATNQKYDLENNAYLSFSGGKDSTILHHLLDMALPNNNIPRVYIDTGIEYQAIREFVMDLASKDKRFTIIKPTRPIKPTLDKYGYPFKSKEFSNIYGVYQKSGITKSVRKFIKLEPSNRKILCPSQLLDMFNKQLDFKISSQCCNKMKKEPIHKWEKANNRPIALTGMRNTEGGQRASIKGCILTDKNGMAKKFHPLLVVSDEWENWFIESKKIELCKLYYSPYNFKRTGCKGCPFSLNLQEQLEIMERYMPNERKQCEVIWKPIYEEYRRLGYRLKKVEEIKLL